MIAKTCAACDCKLDEGAIKVKIGDKTVEAVCKPPQAVSGKRNHPRPGDDRI